MKSVIRATAARAAVLISTSLAGAFAGANTLPYLDEQFGCIDRTLADRYVRDFSIDIRSFGGLELCESTHDGRRILADIYLIENGRFRPLGSNVFIRNFVPADRYYDWTKQQTRGMRRANDIPYATAYNSFGRFTFQDGWAESSTLGRVGTIIHEARHTEGYRHTRCQRGPYANSNVSGCDVSLLQGGSHGVEMEYYARVVLQGENFHPVYKAMARLMALGRSNAFFNQPAITAREGLVIKREGRPGFLLFTGANDPILERMGPTIPDTRLKRSSFGAVLYTGDSAFSLDLYGRAQGEARLADAYSYFKMLFRRDTRAIRLRDMEEFDVGSLRHLAALTEDGRLLYYDFPAGEWTRRPEPTGLRNPRLATLDPTGKAGLIVVADDGTIRPWNAQTKRLEAVIGVRWPRDIKQFSRWGDQLLGLGNNGTIYTVDGERLVPFDPLRGISAEQIAAVPVYDAFAVER